ncbi:hypothetical protein BC835DRAFT_586703 [Cytidiella melzeri]|nr:hypothetical protein BC835DRAFT_586703 [Cytidiella melzeri]
MVGQRSTPRSLLLLCKISLAYLRRCQLRRVPSAFMFHTSVWTRTYGLPQTRVAAPERKVPRNIPYSPAEQENRIVILLYLLRGTLRSNWPSSETGEGGLEDTRTWSCEFRFPDSYARIFR